MANGKLSFEQLKKEVKAGNIDTVIASFPDMQGRLMGKRFEANYFVDGAYEETHGCNYLLAVDVDMEPVPGYKSASWEKGYGDYVIKPDLDTIRLCPWLPKTWPRIRRCSSCGSGPRPGGCWWSTSTRSR